MAVTIQKLIDDHPGIRALKQELEHQTAKLIACERQTAEATVTENAQRKHVTKLSEALDVLAKAIERGELEGKTSLTHEKPRTFTVPAAPITTITTSEAMKGWPAGAKAIDCQGAGVHVQGDGYWYFDDQINYGGHSLAGTTLPYTIVRPERDAEHVAGFDA